MAIVPKPGDTFVWQEAVMPRDRFQTGFAEVRGRVEQVLEHCDDGMFLVSFSGIKHTYATEAKIFYDYETNDFKHYLYAKASR